MSALDRTLPVTVLLAACLILGACDEVRHALDPDGLEERLRTDPDRPGKVGTIVGVTVHQQARRVADDMLHSPDPGCAIRPSADQITVLRTRLERRRGGEVVAFWDETRRFREQANGDVSVSMDASFETRIDESGTRTMDWRLVGDRSFVGERTADGLRWYSRSVEESERARVRRAGLGAFQALLDAADGWRSDGGARWSNGSEPLRCVDADEGLGFVDRFVAGATLQNASLERVDETWQYEASWVLTDQTRIRARATLQFEDATEPIAAPADDAVVDISRDRSYARASTLLEKLANDGLVELPSKPDESTPSRAPDE